MAWGGRRAPHSWSCAGARAQAPPQARAPELFYFPPPLSRLPCMLLCISVSVGLSFSVLATGSVLYSISHIILKRKGPSRDP